MVVAQVQSTQRGHAHEARLTQKKPKEMCKASNYLWFAWNDTPVQQHLLMFFGWFCYDHFRPPVSPWGILRTGYKTRSPLKPLGNLDQFDSHFTDFQHLSRSATFDFWTTNLRGSFLLVWTFWLHLIWWSKTPGLIVRRKLPGKVLCLWFSILGCLVIIAMSDSLFLLPLLWRFVKQIHIYLQIIRLISFVPARCRRSLASHREWLHDSFPKLTVFRTQCFPPGLAVFSTSQKVSVESRNSAMFLSAQCSQKNACTGNPWKIHGSSSDFMPFNDCSIGWIGEPWPGWKKVPVLSGICHDDWGNMGWKLCVATLVCCYLFEHY